MSYFPSLTFSFIYEKKSALNLCIFCVPKQNTTLQIVPMKKIKVVNYSLIGQQF